MTRIARHGNPTTVRFKKEIEKSLATYCDKRKVNKSDVIQESVACFLRNPDCRAKKRFEEDLNP